MMGKRISMEGAPLAPNYFRQWREWKGLRQRDIADPLDITTSAVSNIESGKSAWSKGFLEAFSHIVGCPNISDPITRPPLNPDVEKEIAAIVEAAVRKAIDIAGKRG
jgi:transcriptional regulator with XRE-family HTH domain